MNGLRLDSKQAALKGGYSGPVIVPGNSAESKLVQLVAGLDAKIVMPPVGEKLTAEEVGLLRGWIDQGAEWPEALMTQAEGVGAEESGAGSDHWAFQPLEKPRLPRVDNKAWVRNGVDAFVLARLESEGVEPSPEAEKTTLARRLSLDLTGLPPSPELVEEFVSDSSSDAYERLADRLLDSEHYGEKWAMHWLDPGPLRRQ